MINAPKPDKSGSGKRTLIWLATLAITPGVLWFTQWAHENPWLALPVVAIWELTLLVVSFFLDVWSELRGRVVKRAANRAALFAGSLFLRYRHKYLEGVINQHRNFDVKGLISASTYTLWLKHVFVELRFSPTTVDAASANLLEKLPERMGRYTVWDFLQADGDNSAKLAVLGAPGLGKTTLLKHVALTLAENRSPTQWLRARHNVPIFLFLRDHAKTIAKQPDTRLINLISEDCKKRDLDIPPEWFAAYLARGRCVVMFDGLDEVADPEMRKAVGCWVERQMTIHAKNRFLVTSRPYGIKDNPLMGVNVISILPFSWIQVEDFVHKWYIAIEIKAQQKNDKGVRTDAKLGADDFLRRLHGTSALADFAVNPLLLTMMANADRFGSALPNRRAELYKEICEVALGKRREAKGLPLKLRWTQMQEVLEPLAWRMMSEGATELTNDNAVAAISLALGQVYSPAPDYSNALALNSNKGNEIASQFLVDVKNLSGLLVGDKEDGYAFVHKTFQEFLAACHAQKNPDLVEVLVGNVGKSWWRECLHLFAAIADATMILEACMRKDPPDPEELVLAIECRDEAKQINPQTRAKLDRLIVTGLDETDKIKRQPVATAVLKMRVSQIQKHLADDCYIDRDLVMHAEYQLFLDERRREGEYRQPDHWTETQYLANQARTPVVGLRFSDARAFCAWLTDKQEREGGPWRFRLPTNDENATVDPLWETHELLPWRLVAANSDAASQAWPISIREQQGILIRREFDKLGNLRFSPDLDNDFDRARARARRIRVDDNLDIGRALTIFHVPDRAFASFLADDITHGRDIARARVRRFFETFSIARARALSIGLDRELDFHFDVNSALNLNRELDQDLDQDVNRSLERNPALARARARALVCALDVDLNLDRDFNLASGSPQAFSIVLGQARTLLVARAEMTKLLGLLSTRNLEHIIHRHVRKQFLITLYELLYDYALSISMLWLIAGSELLYVIGDTALPRRKVELAFENVTYEIISCYLFAAFRTSRLKGDDHPFEALRLVKELKTKA